MTNPHRLFDDECDIRRYVAAADGAGGETRSWSHTGSAEPVPCRVDPQTSMSAEDDVEGRRQDRITGTVFVPAGSDVTVADRIDTRGETWEVVNVAHQTRAPLIEVRIVKVEP